MASLNKAELIGHIGNDIELKFTNNGTAFTNFNLATNDNNSQNKENTVEWHYIQVWSKLADICVSHLSKGSQVYVEGKLKTEKWQDKNGVNQRITKIIAYTVLFLVSPNQNTNKEESVANKPVDVIEGDEVPF